MTRALNADWNLAEALYLQGVPDRTTAEKVGVTEMSLRQRPHRYSGQSLKTTALSTAAVSTWW